MARPVRVSSNPVSALIQPVVKYLLSAEREAIKKRIEDICIENYAKRGTYGAYMFEGKFYSIYRLFDYKKVTVRAVHASLEERAKSVFTRTNELKVNEQRLTHSFAVIRRICKNAQDLRDALPDTLVSDVPLLNHMNRVRSEDELLDERPAISQQYQRAIGDILQIKGKRLIFG